jgi:hypothetical protein
VTGTLLAAHATHGFDSEANVGPAVAERGTSGHGWRAMKSKRQPKLPNAVSGSEVKLFGAQRDVAPQHRSVHQFMASHALRSTPSTAATRLSGRDGRWLFCRPHVASVPLRQRARPERRRMPWPNAILRVGPADCPRQPCQTTQIASAKPKLLFCRTPTLLGVVEGAMVLGRRPRRVGLGRWNPLRRLWQQWLSGSNEGQSNRLGRPVCTSAIPEHSYKSRSGRAHLRYPNGGAAGARAL